MNFISYAQNLEDVMLWRALKKIKNGFYIDVGANDPLVDSVTKAFYERGWRGINIEPLAKHYSDLLRERSLDVNLQCAAGDKNGEIEIWESSVRGWASVAPEVIAHHMENGIQGVTYFVPVRKLSEICEKHVTGEIHFLKIDVEGFEKDVINGMDFLKFRPWILVVEATKPNSQNENYDEWERDILDAAYVFAYADGLNRFYVADEKKEELIESFRYPPNVFDGYKRADQLDLELRAEKAEERALFVKVEARATLAEARATLAEARATQAEARATQAEARATQAEARANEHAHQLRLIHQSKSWKLGGPLRSLKKFYLHKRHESLNLIRKIVANIILRVNGAIEYAFKFVNSRPYLKKCLRHPLKKLPILENWILNKRSAIVSSSFYNDRSNIQDPYKTGSKPFQDLNIRGVTHHSSKRNVKEILKLIQNDLSVGE